MSEDTELAKDLGLLSAMTIGIGTMVGAGIFVLPGVAAHRAGPIVVVSFIIGGFIAMFNALSVSELGTAMPKAGGAYYFVNRSLGPVFGSISGLGDWLGLAFASAFYTIGFGQYLAELINLPSILFLNHIQVGALIAGIIFIGVNYLGTKQTGEIQSIIVTILLIILGIFAIVGWFSFDWDTLTSAGGLTPLGTQEILPATGLVFVSYLGYAKIATVAEEMKNPGRNLPIAIVGSVGIVTVLYTILVGLMVGIVPWPDMDADAPVAQAAEIAFPTAVAGLAATIITVGALLATASSANASILASARINFAMGRDRIVTNWLNEIHPDYATPYRSIIITGAMILGFVVLLGQDIELLAEAASVLHLIVFALLNIALIVFRETDHPGYDPDFKVPLYPVVPILGAVLSLGLIWFMELWAQLIAVGFVVMAIVWYLLYARKQTPIQGALGEYIRDRPGEMPDLAVTAAEIASPDATAPYRVMVPISNPQTEEDLIAIGSILANHHGGEVHAVHIIQVPGQTSLERVQDHLGDVDPEAEHRLQNAVAVAEKYGADIKTHTIVSHRSFDEIFDAAERFDATTVVLGWSPQRPWAAGRTSSRLEEATQKLPCDFLVFKDRGFEPDRILLPTAGGPDSDLGADVAKAFQNVLDADLTIMHIVEEEDASVQGMGFLADWADSHGIENAELRVETGGDVEGNIESAMEDHTMLILGATREGLISRLLTGSLVFDIVDEVDSSVILAERPSKRSLIERLIGRSYNSSMATVEDSNQESTSGQNESNEI